MLAVKPVLSGTNLQTPSIHISPPRCLPKFRVNL